MLEGKIPIDGWYKRFGDFPIVFGLEASHAVLLSDNSSLKIGLCFENFKDKDNGYNNHKIELKTGYDADLNRLFMLSLSNTNEFYYYEDLIFVENADWNEEFKKSYSTFMFLNFKGMLKFYAQESCLVYGSIKSTSLYNDSIESTILTFELGTKYLFDFNK